MKKISNHFRNLTMTGRFRPGYPTGQRPLASVLFIKTYRCARAARPFLPASLCTACHFICTAPASRRTFLALPRHRFSTLSPSHFRFTTRLTTSLHSVTCERNPHIVQANTDDGGNNGTKKTSPLEPVFLD